MKKWFGLAMAVSLLCFMVVSALAAQKLNIYLDKEALLMHTSPASDMRIRPEGMVRVTRHSLWPWDEVGSRWSLFVEIENISDEKIVIDEDWLIACRANRDEVASAEYVFEYLTNVVEPGERTVLHAGVYPYAQAKRSNADAKLDVWNVVGMEDFAARICQAEILRVRLEVRGNQSIQSWRAVKVEPKIWMEGRTLHFEWFNDTEETMDFRTIGAVACDKTGRIIDLICSSFSRGASAEPGGTLRIEKELAPYVTEEMLDGVSFDAFAFRMGQE